MALRKRFLIPLIVVATVLLVVVPVTAWYGWRVFTELGGNPWRNPTVVLDRDGETILEMYGDAWRPADPVLLENLPEEIPLAFLAAEDVRFRRHLGLDPVGIARAALTNVRSGGIAQGGSTITQQLAKGRYFSNDRTFRRKALEAIVAVLIELRLSKDEILEAYLNDVYLGHHDGRAILGIDEGARIYFDEAPEDLSVAQAALLAGMIRAPNADREPENAKKRRDAILAVMRDQGWITAEQHDEAIDDPIRFDRGSLRSASHPWALNAIRRELIDAIGERQLRAGGLKVHTTIDLNMQNAAERAVREGVRRLRGRHSWLRRSDEPLQAALLSADVATGGIRAVVGGSNWNESQFDRTWSMRRQAGSALKPFTYAAAIAEGEITPATLVEDEPIEIRLAANEVWAPHNYDERFRGTVTVREAFEKSLNVPAVRIAEDTGIRRIRRTLERANAGDDFSNTPAIALGVDEVSMRDLLEAYTIFPNTGRRVTPHLISRVENRNGRTIHRQKIKPRKVLDPEVAFLVHSLMRGVVERGTASALERQGLGHVAGKTGTTNDYRDAWFAGYTKQLVTVTWVGFDEGRPLRISSAEAALPVWASYMRRVPHDEGELEPPEGVSTARVERSTGLLWQDGCGSSVVEYFIAGTEPSERCVPRRRQEPASTDYVEPPIITLDTLRDWMKDAPGVLDETDVIGVPADEVPGAEPGDIIIQIPPPVPDSSAEGDDPAGDDVLVPETGTSEREEPADVLERQRERVDRERERAEERLERERERAEDRLEREAEKLRDRLDPPSR